MELHFLQVCQNSFNWRSCKFVENNPTKCTSVLSKSLKFVARVDFVGVLFLQVLQNFYTFHESWYKFIKIYSISVLICIEKCPHKVYDGQTGKTRRYKSPQRNKFWITRRESKQSKQTYRSTFYMIHKMLSLTLLEVFVAEFKGSCKKGKKSLLHCCDKLWNFLFSSFSLRFSFSIQLSVNFVFPSEEKN